jgi:hypothetical protein
MGISSLELWVWHNRKRNEKPDQRVALPVGVGLFVGRERDADVCVQSVAVSRRHLHVRRDETGVWVADMQTHGGAFVNGSRILEPTLVKCCDTIRLAGVELRLVPAVEMDAAWLRWNDATVPRLARVIYEEGRWNAMGVLHDALLDAGCDNEEMLTHAREQEMMHTRGCWLIDLLLNKE